MCFPSKRFPPRFHVTLPFEHVVSSCRARDVTVAFSHIKVSFCDHSPSVVVVVVVVRMSVRPSTIFKQHLLLNHWFWPNFTGMILGWSSFKVVQMVPVLCTSRSQELKIDFFTKNIKNLLFRNHWTDFNIILQKCSFGDPLPRLFKPFRFVKKHGRQGVGLIFPIYLYRKL